MIRYAQFLDIYFTLRIPEIRTIIVSRAKSKVRTDGLLITMKLTLSVQGEVGDYKCANNFNTFVRRSKVLRRILHIFCFLQIVTRQWIVKLCVRLRQSGNYYFAPRRLRICWKQGSWSKNWSVSNANIIILLQVIHIKTLKNSLQAQE